VGPSKDETFTESPAGAAPLAHPEAYLLVVLECDRPLSGSSRHCLRGIDEVTVGRGTDRIAARTADRLALSMPGGWLSSAHLRIHRDGPRWLLEDVQSRNGTRVNGESVVHHALRDGDLVEAGHTLILFREALHAPPAVALDFDTRSASWPGPGLETLVPAFAGEIDALARISASAVPVLLRGESGTGKELAARAIHAMRGRGGAFVAINCGAIPPALVESHLFGHTKGAFSGAVRDEPGFVRASSGGTLFLDEIGDLPATSQAALLRVLQEGEVTPVGATRALPVDLRVIAATHQPLEDLAARGAFRSDLLARLEGFTFALPPLRERREDLGLLVAQLLGANASQSPPLPLSPEVGLALFRYDWPKNIRELSHCLARACALAKGEARVELAHLPAPVRTATGTAVQKQAAGDPAEPPLQVQLERLLARHDGDVAQVARSLGKARMQVYRWLSRFGIDPDRYRK
jgi:transcriptional regulator of acetoin/glycerol metabolism